MRIHIGEAEPILVLAVLILGPIILVSCWRTLGNDSKRVVIMPHDENFEDVCGLQYDLMVSIMMHEDVLVVLVVLFFTLSWKPCVLHIFIFTVALFSDLVVPLA